MIRIALISPKGNVFGKNERMAFFLENTNNMESFRYLWTGPNLGLLTIAAYFPEDWVCDYIDENYKPIDYSKDYDIVCISAMTQQIVNAYEIASKFKEKGTMTVLGGIHATILTEEAGRWADVVIAGEGEELWPLFIEDYKKGQVRKYYREAEAGKYCFENARIPRYDLLEGYSYPIVTLQTTRGCPHDCAFCCASKIFGVHYRRKGNESILRELMEIQRRFPDVLVLFADDNMFVKRKESKDLLRQMEKMDLRWIAQTDISIAEDPELLELMVRSGCQWVVIGFESVSYNSLYNLDNKNWKLKQLPRYSDMIEKIQSYGIHIYGTFIVGLDSDGTDIFAATADFIKKSMLYGANITVPTPLPGTRLREKLENEGRIINKDWSYYTFWDVTIKPKNMTSEELEEGLLEIYRQISDSTSAIDRLIHLRKMIKRRKEVLRSG